MENEDSISEVQKTIKKIVNEYSLFSRKIELLLSIKGNEKADAFKVDLGQLLETLNDRKELLTEIEQELSDSKLISIKKELEEILNFNSLIRKHLQDCKDYIGHL
jgi:archaellum component FlaC